jgi:hypothetical protein
MSFIAVKFAYCSFDNPRIVTERLKKNKVMPEGKLILTDIQGLEAIKQNELLPLDS